MTLSLTLFVSCFVVLFSSSLDKEMKRTTVLCTFVSESATPPSGRMSDPVELQGETRLIHWYSHVHTSARKKLQQKMVCVSFLFVYERERNTHECLWFRFFKKTKQNKMTHRMKNVLDSIYFFFKCESKTRDRRWWAKTFLPIRLAVTPGHC